MLTNGKTLKFRAAKLKGFTVHRCSNLNPVKLDVIPLPTMLLISLIRRSIWAEGFISKETYAIQLESGLFFP